MPSPGRGIILQKSNTWQGNEKHSDENFNRARRMRKTLRSSEDKGNIMHAAKTKQAVKSTKYKQE